MRPEDVPLPPGPSLRMEEARRLDSFARRDAAARSRGASLLLGHLAAHALRLPPEIMVIGRNDRGAPLIEAPRLAPPAVSLAHGAGWLAAVVAVGGRVGIDVEAERLVPRAALEDTLTDQEAAAAAAYPGLGIRLWCLKEAWLKALGSGFRHDPRKAWFRVAGQTVSCHGEAAGWSARLIAPAVGVVGAVCSDTIPPEGWNAVQLRFGVSTP